MSSGIQQGATHAKIEWGDCAGSNVQHWTGGKTLPILNESYGRTPSLFVGGYPFVSHLIVADHFPQAYGVYIDAIADGIMIDDETLKDYEVGRDEDGNPEYSEVEWTSGGEPVDTAYVGMFEVPVEGVTFLYRPPAS